MPIHWTDFPEHVEKFGDLFNIFETLDRDVRANIVHSGSCSKESDASAYSVEFMGLPYEFIPRAERIPGWEQLATHTEREYRAAPSLEILRSIRGFVSEVRDVPIAAVNEMTILDVATALDQAHRQPVSSGSGADYLLAEFRWLKVGQVASLFALTSSQVSKLSDAGSFITNGKTGHDRRIDVLSVVKRELDRLNRPDSASAGTEE